MESELFVKVKPEKVLTKEELENIIAKANDAYWNQNDPIISDSQYDEYMWQLSQLDPKNKLLKHIGGERGKYRHDPPMLSLNKAYTHDAVVAWATSVARDQNEMIKVQPKYDGLAGKIENGRLSTRGDGYFGEDITTHTDLVCVEHIINDPNTPDGSVSRRYDFSKYINLVEVKTKKQIYGELIIDNKTFEEYFVSGKILRADGAKYSNPRNAVAGLFNQKDISMLPKNIVTFVPYENQSFLTAYYRLSSIIGSLIEDIVCEYKPKYPLDGIVFKLADLNYYDRVGTTAHHPKGAIAFKFMNSSGIGRVHDVVWQSGKESLTPVLILEEPVVLSNCNITRATLHNYKFFNDIRLRKGALVRIEKAGDIIPKVVEVIEEGDGELLQAPTCCPIDHCPVEIDGVELECMNNQCPGKQIPRMVYGAKVLGIDGLGPSTVQLLKNRLNVQYLWMLLFHNLTFEIGCLPGFTDYSAEILMRNVNAVVGKVSESQVFAACCVPGVGVELARRVFEKYTFEDLTKMHTDRTLVEHLTQVVGPSRADAIQKAYDDNAYNNMLTNMFKYFHPVTELANHDDQKPIVCFSGKFEDTRQMCKNFVESYGFKFTDKMTKDVKFLVVPSLDRRSSKTEYANKHNIPVMTLETFKESINVQRS